MICCTSVGNVITPLWTRQLSTVEVNDLSDFLWQLQSYNASRQTTGAAKADVG